VKKIEQFFNVAGYVSYGNIRLCKSYSHLSCLLLFLLKPFINGTSGSSAAIDCIRRQRRTVYGIACSKHFRLTGLKIIYLDIAAPVKLQVQIFNNSIMNNVFETKSQNYKVCCDGKICSGKLPRKPAVIIFNPFNRTAIDSSNSRFYAGKTFCLYAPDSIASFFVRRRCSHYSRPVRPGSVRRS